MLEQPSSQRGRLMLILDAIADHANQPETLLTLGALAGGLGLSISTTQRVLRKEQLDFRTVVSMMRLVSAERLLRKEPTLKVEALGLLAGWRSRKSLYAAVKRVRGCSLAQWRARVLKGPIDAPPDATHPERPEAASSQLVREGEHESCVTPADDAACRARVELLVALGRFPR